MQRIILTLHPRCEYIKYRIRTTRTMRSNDTLVDTPFQIISGFFHVNQGVLCSEHAEQASCRGVLEGGGGLLNKGGGATGFLV